MLSATNQSTLRKLSVQRRVQPPVQSLRLRVQVPSEIHFLAASSQRNAHPASLLRPWETASESARPLPRHRDRADYGPAARCRKKTATTWLKHARRRPPLRCPSLRTGDPAVHASAAPGPRSQPECASGSARNLVSRWQPSMLSVFRGMLPCVLDCCASAYRGGKTLPAPRQESTALATPKHRDGMDCNDWCYGRAENGRLPRRETAFRTGTQRPMRRPPLDSLIGRSPQKL